MSKINIRVKLKPSSAITGTTGIITGANNVGGGIGLYKNISSNNLQFKTLVAGDNISLSATTDTVIINATQAQTSGVTQSEFDSYTGATDTTLSGLRSDVDTVSGQTDTNTSDISGLRTDVDTVSGQTDTNTNNIATNTTNIGVVSGQTNTNTNDISSLQNNKLDDVVAGTNITIDKTDPLNPIISASGGGGTTDGVVSGATLSGDTLSLQRTEGLTDVTVDVSALDQSNEVISLQSDVSTLSGDTANKVDLDATIVSQSSSVTLSQSNNNNIIECTGSITITIPTGLSTGWQVFITNVGTGTITIASNGTLQSKGGLVTIADQYAGATVYHRGSDEHLLQGDLT